MVIIKLNIIEFENFQKKRRLSDAALADTMNMDRTTVWRIKTGKCNPGQDFIANTLNTFKEAKFEDLFCLVQCCVGSTQQITN